MGLFYNVTASITAFLLIALALAYVSISQVRVVRSVHAKPDNTLIYDRLVDYSAQNNAAKRLSPQPSNSTQSSINDKCIMAPESRFDCARDRVLSHEQCEDRGCCYVPLPDTTGPPWCFYPHLYPGYIMGPLSPTRRGQAATLTRAKPSYLPKDISTLRLEIIEESGGCLHLTVSNTLTM